MNRIKNLNKLFFSLLFFSLFFGILFRSYNLNYDNLWFDEIVSFWVSDPTISFKESFERVLGLGSSIKEAELNAAENFLNEFNIED